MSDAKTQESAVDCRECMHGHNFEHGLGYRCAKADARMPWSVVASDPCEEFEAAPPASAGREEPGLLEAARAAFPLLTDWDVDPESDDDGQWEADCRAFKAETGLTYGPLTHRSFKSWSVGRDRRVRNDLAAAISAEAFRRVDRRLPCGCVRCACEDPEQCQGCGGREAAACQASRLSGGPKHASAQPAAVDPRDATIRDLRERLETSRGAHRIACDVAAKYQDDKIALDATIRDLRALLQKCAAEAQNAKKRLGRAYSVSAERGLLDSRDEFTAGEIALHDLLSDLRAAGVEPAPAQEGKATT